QTPRDLQVDQLLNEESENRQSRKSIDRSRSIASRMRSRGSAPSPTARKTGAKSPKLKSTSQNPMEKLLGESALLSRLSTKKTSDKDRKTESTLTAQERIQREIQRREDLRKTAQSDKVITGVRVRMSDSEMPTPSQTESVAKEPLPEPSYNQVHKPENSAEDSKNSELRIAKVQNGMPVARASSEELVKAGPTPETEDSMANIDAQVSGAEVGELGHALLTQMQAQAESASLPETKIEIEKKMRLVQMALGDLESAQQPIDGLEAPTQEYISQTLKSLHEATRRDGNPSTSRKMTKALQIHREAAQSLASVASLEVSNCAFCTEIDGFGDVKEFKEYRFRADQQVLLYCELENFVSEETPDGFCTKLQGNYEIIDSDGNRVLEQVLPEDRDMCAQKRRDFYIAYRFYLPKRIPPGNYQLRLVIEDMQGHKFGNAELDFEIVE
ncbi:MAG: hypothetical protein AAF483_18005, partial [Planctomycetota bacterium]